MSRYIITGNLSSPQNVSSITAWLREYAPVLKDVDPGMALTVAGRSPAATILEAASAVGARVVPSPEDMSALLKEADIYICPSDNGSGIKLRMMDGLKQGLPIVAHVLAARGYEMFVGKSVFLYDSGDTFRKAVADALGMHCDREELIGLYRECFSFEAGVKRLRDIVEGL